MKKKAKFNFHVHLPFKISIIYAIFSTLWILLSDQILFFFIKDPEIITKTQTVKGWIFIVITSVIIFFLLQKEIKKYVQTEAALGESEEKMRRIPASAQDAIIMMDSQGTVSFWNESAERIFGYTPQEIIGQELHKILAQKQFYDIYHEKFQHFKETGKGTHLGKIVELSGVKKDGSIFPIELSLSSVNMRQQWYAIGIIRDITDRKRAEMLKNDMEKKLQQAQKMESIGILAGGIAHDFNNILSAIIGYTELAQLDIPQETKAAGYLNNILKSGNRARDLIQQILTFSRQTDIELKPLSVKMIAQEVLKLIRASTPSTIEISENLMSESFVLGDETQIHQILMNLCTNASQAMQKNGGILEVTLKDEVLNSKLASRYTDLKSGDYVKLIVKDNGCGMMPKEQDHIFDPFFTTKDKGKGTGMGLAVVHGIVKSYKGAVTVDSELGKGSTFEIFLPIVKNHLILEEQPKNLLPTGKEKILFVDDEPELVDIGKKLLEDLGYSIITTTEPQIALNLFRERPSGYDLVITDMTMPNMTGDKLAEQLLTIRKDIPILLFTGFSLGMTEEKAKKIGVKGFLMKPITRSELARTIRKILDDK